MLLKQKNVSEKELEAQLADRTKKLEERNKALDKRESDVDKKAETIAQNVSEQVRQQMSAAKTRFEKNCAESFG